MSLLFLVSMSENSVTLMKNGKTLQANEVRWGLAARLRKQHFG